MTQVLPVPAGPEQGCCPPLAAAPLSEGDAEVLAARLKALADPARLRLLSLVLAGERGEACVCDLTAPVGLSQPTVSHHLKVLVEAGLLRREQRGRWAYFSAQPETLTALAEVLAQGFAPHAVPAEPLTAAATRRTVRAARPRTTTVARPPSSAAG